MTALGLVDYDKSGNFAPERLIFRSETVVLLIRAKQYPLPDKTEQIFVDVSADFWAAAKEQGLFNYLGDSPFVPQEGLTRAEFAEILYRTKFSKEKMKEAGMEE